MKTFFKHRLQNVLLGACVGLFTLLNPATYAADLLTVYQDAIENDAVLRAAKAQLLSNKELLPQAYSFLLLNSDMTASAGRRQAKGSFISGTQNQTNRNLLINLTQPVFDVANWSNVSVAKASVKQAHAVYIGTLQNLITRVATSYFLVLDAEDRLRFILAEKAAFERQLVQAKERFKVGLDPITNVYNAQASYDTTVADEIAARNNIQNQLENLRVITGIRYDSLQPLRKKTPLETPNPNDVEEWVEVARENNLNVIATRFASLSAKATINVNRANHLPVISAFGDYSDTFLSNSTVASTNTYSRFWEIGMQIAMPIYTGGFISSQVRQSRYDYQTTLETLESAYRTAVNDTHQRYNDVVAGISKIRADRQAIISNESSVKSNEESFKVGTRTIIDVLNAQQLLTEAQQVHATDQYAYILNILSLKEAAGVLTIQDLTEINNWLDLNAKRTRYIVPTQPVFKPADKIELNTTGPEAIQIPEAIVDTPDPQASVTTEQGTETTAEN